MSAKQEFHIPINIDGVTAVACLAEASGISKQKIKQYMQKGCVWLERRKDQKDEEIDPSKRLNNSYIQRLRRAKKILKSNQILHFYFDENVLNSVTPEAILIKDFGEYSIWNKPSGMLSQGSKWGDHSTIYRWAETHLEPERPAFVVHRLDRAANGLIILAHKKNVAKQFSKLFENRQIEKCYQVKVEGDFSRRSSSGKKLKLDSDIDKKTAISYVEMLSFNETENSSLLEVQIETGRKHQIRKHLANIGFPVVGDRLHGSGQYSDHIDLQLQAKSLAFICPVSSEQRSFKLDS